MVMCCPSPTIASRVSQPPTANRQTVRPPSNISDKRRARQAFFRCENFRKDGKFNCSYMSAAPDRPPQNKDSTFTQVHMHRAGDADLFEDFCRDRLPDDEVYVPSQHQPVNPEDEDDVVPDQHAAFGIQRATQGHKEPAWKDLGLGDLMNKGPPPAMGRPTAPSGKQSGRSLPR